jgi:hypothetical protein
MKNFIKLFVIVLALALVFISCEKGGTIEVYNSTSYTALVQVVKGDLDILDKVKDSLSKGSGTEIASGKTRSFTKDEDGIYLIVAAWNESSGGINLQYSYDTAVLLAGNTTKVTIKK